jgi:predicted tellurium resistance membrane protein TerC
MPVAKGTEQHIDKGYVYFAMAFSVAVEMLNLQLRAKRDPVLLRERHMQKQGAREADRDACGRE